MARSSSRQLLRAACSLSAAVALHGASTQLVAGDSEEASTSGSLGDAPIWNRLQRSVRHLAHTHTHAWPSAFTSRWRGLLPQSLIPVALAESPQRPVLVALDLTSRASLLQPLLQFMPDVPPDVQQPLSEDALRAVEATALAAFDGPQPLQALTLAWVLAWNGHQPGPAYLARLQAAAASGSFSSTPGSRAGPGPAPSPAYRAVLLWCAAMHGAATPDVWEPGLRALAAAAAPPALDECALLYLLHAAMMVAADSAPPARRAAAGARVSPASPAAASAASPACQPRATREEVLAAAGPLGRKLAARLAEVYGEYVPLHPTIEGPYLALLFVLEQLAAAGEGGAGAGGGDGALAPPGGLGAPPGVAAAAAATLASPKELARLKRDLLYHWRGDTLLDEVQRVRNQVVYLLTRRMGLTVAQPDDVDVALPSRWLAIYVRPGTAAAPAPAPPAAAAAADAGAAAAAASAAGGGGGGVEAELRRLEDAGAEVMEALARERFAPHVRQLPARVAAAAQQQGRGQEAASGGGASGSGSGRVGGPPGLWAARVRQLRRLGWRVVVVDARAWGALGSDAEREAHLLRLLRGAA